MAGGRPSKYTPELAQEICDTISSCSLSVRQLCNLNDNWPDFSQIFRWRNTNLEFRNLYAQAKKNQVEVSVDFMQELMNEPHIYTDPETGIERVDVPLLRVKIDAIKWKAAKLMPKDYGDMKQLETVNNEVNDDCKKRYSELDNKNRKDY